MAEAEKTESVLRREADYAATQKLKASHVDEFNEFKIAEMKARGIDWKPKPTEKEKAAEQLRLILAQHPELASEVAGSQ